MSNPSTKLKKLFEIVTSENSSTLIDNLSDGQWHSIRKINRHSGPVFKRNKKELVGLLESLREAGCLIYGNNESYRLHPDAIKGWRMYRELPLNPPNKVRDLTAPRYFGGILEDEGWLLAPLRTHDLVHFRISGNITVDDVQLHLGVSGIARQDIDGLIRVSCGNGQAVYDAMKSWEPGSPSRVTGVRLDRGVQRRELTDLPSGFLSDLCAFYGSYAHTLLRRSMSSVTHHISESDDIQQQIYIWVVDAIQRYDATTSIPFAAFLHSSLKHWVHDLNRKSYGRAAADTELKYSRAIASFVEDHHRQPTIAELAEVLGEDAETVSKKMTLISRVAGLRAPTSLSGEDSYQIPVTYSEGGGGEEFAAHSTDTATVNIAEGVELSYEESIERSLLSAALTSTANEFSSPPVLAWLKTYDSIWNDNREPSLRRISNKRLLEKMKDKVERVSE